MSPLPASYISNRGITVRGAQRVFGAVYHQVWTDPATADTNGILETLAGPNAATLTLTPGVGLGGAFVSGNRLVLPYARNVVITVTHATSVVAESGVITGTDIYGRPMTEAWSVTATGTSKTFTGLKAFKTITQLTITAATDASANSNIAGDGVKFGLDVKCSVGGTGAALKEIAAGSLVATGVIVAASAVATADPRGTYAPAAAPNGSNDYEVWFISDDPENS